MSQIAWKLDNVTLQKIGKGLLIAMGGAIGTWLLSNVDLISSLFAAYPKLVPFVPAAISFLGNGLYNWARGKEELPNG